MDGVPVGLSPQDRRKNSDRPETVFSVPEETPTAALTAADFCCKLEKITRIFFISCLV
jgi:hypothetical protein